MKALSLFTGAGGADLGITEAGIEVVRGIEIDAHCVSTCHAAGLDHVRQGDVRDLSLFEGLGPLGLLFGGPPCQAFSRAGPRRAQDDTDRNGWPWTLDVIDHVRPRWVLLENVPGLLCHSKNCTHPCPGCYWAGDLLPAFKARYPCVEHRILNASCFGVPQHRRRVFLCAGPTPIRWPQPSHGVPLMLSQGELFDQVLLPWTTVNQALGLSSVFGGGTRGHGMEEWRPRDCTNTPAPTVNAMMSSTAAIYSEGHPGECGTAAYLQQPSPTIAAGNGGKGSGQWSANQEIREKWQETSGIRRLSVRECAILQDFPANYPFQGTKTNRYAQVGNAWPRTFGRVLGWAILEKDAVVVGANCAS